MSTADVGAPSRGAYGFRVLGLDGLERLLVEARSDWPAVTVDWVEDPSLPEASDQAATSRVRFTSSGARIELGRSGVIEIDAAEARVRVTSNSVAGGSAVVHPYLGAAVSVLARWRGHESFHAGAFVSGGGAWGVVGSRTAGKSSLLALLHAGGRGVLADDVLVLGGRGAFAAPRSLDLRRETAERLGLGAPLGIVGARERWRVELASVPSEVPFRGWIHLAWGERVELEAVRGADRLARLRAQLTIPDVPVDAGALLALAALPSFELRRPPDWAAAEGSVSALLRLVG